MVKSGSPKRRRSTGPSRGKLNGRGGAVGDPRRCRLIEQRCQFPPGGFAAVETNDQLAAQVKRRHADGVQAESIGEILQIRQCLAIFAYVANPNPQRGPGALQLRQESFGGFAIGTTGTDKNLQFLGRRWLGRH